MCSLYYAFIHPYFNYCISVWGNTYQSYLDPLIKLQKKAVRLISGAKYLAHTAPLFENLKILTIQKLYLYSVQLFLYKHHHRLLPEMFLDFFTTNRNVHTYPTRQQDLYHTQYSYSHAGQKALRYIGVNVFNHFVKLVDLKLAIPTYKRKLRTYIVSNDVQFLL